MGISDLIVEVGLMRFSEPSLEEQLVHLMRAGRSLPQRAVVIRRDYPKLKLGGGDAR
jgi:hypothetical protein